MPVCQARKIVHSRGIYIASGKAAIERHQRQSRLISMKFDPRIDLLSFVLSELVSDPAASRADCCLSR